ncbi:hypothetical protein QS713_06585 [Gleimia hominis]|uniref:ATP-grasp domain-containing protein n=1 Tax=Gleimia hominis TaxID=595468 RepID=A0ABU3IBG6_9ACTO|nr:hypothetical protein [Gleimia hominis]MDT3767724.1 hypothetical protein [Gleimia hominis]
MEQGTQSQEKLGTRGFVPVILGGGVEAYAMARQFNDLGCERVICISSAPSQLVKLSRFIELEPIENGLDPSCVVETLTNLSVRYAPAKLAVITNGDEQVENLIGIRSELPKTCELAIPSREVLEEVSNKARFKRVCERAGIATIAFEAVEPAAFSATQLTFPIVAKPAVSAEFSAIEVPDKKKVYYLQTPAELADLMKQLADAGYPGEFVLEEYIPGDDAQLHSITAYISRGGAVTMLAHAQVALQDHRPSLVGNPVTMVTSPQYDLFEAAERFFQQIDYEGFANFDVKVDPRTGTPYFLELNPRIGRNSGYVQGGGVNAMGVFVDDVIHGRRGGRKVAQRELIYSLVPLSIAQKHLHNPQLRARFKQLRQQRKVFNPLRNPREKLLARDAFLLARDLHLQKVFHDYPPAEL